jgi:hypothetical protein
MAIMRVHHHLCDNKMSQQNDGLLQLFFPFINSLLFLLSYHHSQIMVSSPNKSVLSKVHRDKSRITKGARKELHTFAADALDKLPLSANIDDYVVGVKLGTFTRGLSELEEEVSGAQ